MGQFEPVLTERFDNGMMARSRMGGNSPRPATDDSKRAHGLRQLRIRTYATPRWVLPHNAESRWVRTAPVPEPLEAAPTEFCWTSCWRLRPLQTFPQSLSPHNRKYGSGQAGTHAGVGAHWYVVSRRSAAL